MTISTIPKPIANFDKSRWSWDPKHSLNGFIRLMTLLFEKTADGRSDSSARRHEFISSYERGQDLLRVYFLARDSSQPDVRIVPDFSTGDSSSTFSDIQRALAHEGRDAYVSKNGKSLNLKCMPAAGYAFPTGPQYSRDSDDAGFQDQELRSTTIRLVDRLDRVLLNMGFVRQWRALRTTPTSMYDSYVSFKSDWFRVSISSSPNLRYMPPACLQIDNFGKSSGNSSYMMLFFLLRCLMIYGSAAKPSEIELAFDFPDVDASFLLQLTSSIYCKKTSFGWIADRKSPMNSYEETCDHDSLIHSTHYLGRYKDKDYQVSMYNRPDCVRLEFKLRSDVLRRLRIDCVGDLFVNNWPIEFLDRKRFSFGSPTKKALESVLPSYHYLAERSLCAFLSKIPSDRKMSLRRDCIGENELLRGVLENAATEFHGRLSQLLKNSGILVANYGIDTKELRKNSSGDARSSLLDSAMSELPVIELDTLLDSLPDGAYVSTRQDDDFIRFSFFDAQGRLLAKVLVGMLTQNILEANGPWSLERFSAVFRPGSGMRRRR